MNLARPPFQIIPGQSTQDAATDILATFNLIAKLPNKVGRTFSAITGQLKIEQSNPLFSAGLNLAQAADAETYPGNNHYHNTQHYCEVMLSSYFLSLLSGMDELVTAETVLAALIHDFLHDGKPNGDIPFSLERMAIDVATPFLSRANVSQTQQQCLTALVLATEPLYGINITQTCFLHHTQRHSLPEIPPEAFELKELCNNPVRSKQALILCEADILPSIGLSFEHALQLQDKLAMEWDVPLELKDKLHFIEHNSHTFIVGSFFNSNVEKLRLAIKLMLDN